MSEYYCNNCKRTTTNYPYFGCKHCYWHHDKTTTNWVRIEE